MNENILRRKHKWSLMFRIESKLPTNNVNCSNYCEVSFRITKDLKFNRNRAFNQLELLKIECDDSSYYSQRCVDVASNTLSSRLVNQNSRFLNRRAVAIDPDKIRRESDGTFTVPSETKEDVEYSVDLYTWDTCILAYLGYLDTWILAYLVCFGLPWSTLICLGLLGLFQITIERLKCSKAISGRMGLGMGWKSL